MASNGVNGAFHDDEEIDYSDIEAKYVLQSQTFHRRSNTLCRYQVEYDESFDNILVVDGVPIIDKAKLEKGMIAEVELVKLQRKMLDLFEDMSKGDQ